MLPLFACRGSFGVVEAWLRYTCAAIVATAIFLSVSRVALANPTAQLVYTRGAGAEDCPDESSLRSLIMARLGYDPFDPNAPMQITASITKRGQSLRGDVQVRDADGNSLGSRVLTSPHQDCGELAASMAFAISIAIDPLSFSRPHPPTAPASPPPAPTPTPTPAPTVAPPPTAPAAPTPKSESPSSPVFLRLGAGGLGALGAAPAASIGAEIFAGVGWRAVSVDLEGRADLPASASAGAGAGEVTTSLLLLTLAPCVHFRPAFACILGSAGTLQASSSGVDVTRSDSGFYADAGARIGAEIFFIKQIALRVHVDLVAVPTQVTLYLNSQNAWTSSSIAASFGIDVLALFSLTDSSGSSR